MGNNKYKTFEEALGDFNPIEALIDLFNETDDTSLKMEIWAILLNYINPLMQEE